MVQKEPLTKEQKEDVEELASILQGGHPSMAFICRITASAYIAGVKAGAAIRPAEIAPRRMRTPGVDEKRRYT